MLGPHAVFTVELKSWGGRIVGNRDRWTLADGTVVQSPIPLILSKARVLKGRLVSRRRELGSVWVQGIVLLSAADAVAQITRDFEDFVVNLDGVRKALTDPAWLGHPASITPTQRRAIEAYLNDDSLHDGRPTRVRDQLEDYRLVQRLAAETVPSRPGWRSAPPQARAPVLPHLHPRRRDRAERERLRAHALREATLTTASRQRRHPPLQTYFAAGRPNLVLQFEDARRSTAGRPSGPKPRDASSPGRRGAARPRPRLVHEKARSPAPVPGPLVSTRTSRWSTLAFSSWPATHRGPPIHHGSSLGDPPLLRGA